MKKQSVIIAALGIFVATAWADNFSSVNVTGNITAGGSISSTGNMFSNGVISAGNYIYATNYVTAPTGSFTAVLRSGGGVNVGVNSVALAGGTANGKYSLALGLSTNSASYGSIVVGRNNTTATWDNLAPTTGTWQERDQLFTVGNGTGIVGDPNQNRNAFTIYKDGLIKMGNAVTVYPTGAVTLGYAQGDISMGPFGN